VACHRFSIIPHGVRVDASLSLGRDVFVGRKSKPTGDSLRKYIVVGHFSPANNGLLVSNDSEWDQTSTDHHMEITREAEQKMLEQIGMVCDFLQMWQGSQNLQAIQKESCAQNYRMTAVEYISDTQEIVKVSWSLFQLDGATAYTLEEKSPVPPALSANDLSRGQTLILNVRQMQ
jgi:hypothetical protein